MPPLAVYQLRPFLAGEGLKTKVFRDRAKHQITDRKINSTWNQKHGGALRLEKLDVFLCVFFGNLKNFYGFENYFL